MSSVDEAIWCDPCQCYVERQTLRRWSGDDAVHWLCPGCDSDLVFPILPVDEWYEEKYGNDHDD